MSINLNTFFLAWDIGFDNNAFALWLPHHKIGGVENSKPSLEKRFLNHTILSGCIGYNFLFS